MQLSKLVLERQRGARRQDACHEGRPNHRDHGGDADADFEAVKEGVLSGMHKGRSRDRAGPCLLYTSDAADE